MSVNAYNSSTGVTTVLANGQRLWLGSKAAHDAAVSAGTIPNNCLIAITDDGYEGDIAPVDIKNGINSTYASWNNYASAKAMVKNGVLYISYTNMNLIADAGWITVIDLSSFDLGDIEPQWGEVETPCGVMVGYSGTNQGKSNTLHYKWDSTNGGRLRIYSPIALIGTASCVIPLKK